MDRVATFLPTRPPGAKQDEEIGDADVAVDIQVGQTAAFAAQTPATQQPEQVLYANSAISVQVSEGDLVSWIELVLVRPHVHDYRHAAAGIEVGFIRVEAWVAVKINGKQLALDAVLVVVVLVDRHTPVVARINRG